MRRASGVRAGFLLLGIRLASPQDCPVPLLMLNPPTGACCCCQSCWSAHRTLPIRVTHSRRVRQGHFPAFGQKWTLAIHETIFITKSTLSIFTKAFLLRALGPLSHILLRRALDFLHKLRHIARKVLGTTTSTKKVSK